MGSLSKIIKEKGGELGRAGTEKIKVQQIHFTKLKESALNFYTRSEEEVAELADTMLIAGGILQPLIVRKTDLSEYEILAGHKRRRASIYNVKRGYKEYEFLPCIVIDMSGLMAKKISEKILAEQGDIENDVLLDMIAEYIVICTNSTSSESSSYEKMMQSVRLAKILPAMLENEDLKGRALRAEIAKEMKCSDGQVGRYQSIYNHLIPEAMERFQKKEISFSVAYSLSGIDSSLQQLALKKQQITISDIECLKQEKNKATVSNLDTERVLEKDDEAASDSDINNVNQYHYHEETIAVDELAAGKNKNFEQADDTEGKLAAENKSTAASVVSETAEEDSTDYTLDDIRNFHGEQMEVVQQIEEHAMNCGGMIRGSKREAYKKACMTFDGLSYLLKKFEGNDRKQYEITLPCRIGDTIYSIIGDKVTSYKIAGFRIDNEKIYMETSGSMLFAADKIGIFHFFSQDMAEEKFQKMWKERRKD